MELPGGGREVDLTSREGCASGVGAGEKCLCNKAFFLDSVKEPEKHHCMMGLVSNADGSFIELPEDFKNDNGLWEFLRMHPQIAYNNITIEMPEERIFIAQPFRLPAGAVPAGNDTYLESICADIQNPPRNIKPIILYFYIM